MSNFNVNICVEDIISQRENEAARVVQNSFNVNNYLQARLGENEDSKEITIRLLPFTPEGGSPFHKVYMHQVKVNKEVSASGWKRFPCPNKNHLGKPCPFCETSELARRLKKEATSEVDKKRFEEAEIASYAKPMWIVRCIERGHEEDGVKFWLFSDSKLKDGVYDKIYAIFKKRLEKGKNIFDVNEGKDLCLTLTKDSTGKTRINITDEDDLTPITTNYELGLSWINDTKQWTDVYTVKPYEYMSIIIRGGVPVFDKVKQTYVDKNELLKEKEAQEHVSNDVMPKYEEVPIPTVVNNNSNNNSVNTDDDDDLPF